MRRALIGLAIVVGCGSPAAPDDGGTIDAAASDASGSDASGSDAAASDAAASDAAASDAGGSDGSALDAAASDAAAVDGGPVSLALPPADAMLDYQLGGAYPPPAGVTVLSRDRNAAPAPGLYNVCYVNGFQIQPDEESFWTSTHPDLVLRDGAGDPVIDADWNEMLIDVGTPEKRAAVAAIVGDWIAGCASAGFDAVEIDNLDSYTRSLGLLTELDAVSAMRLFADAAHAHGLAIAQKNAAELLPRRAEMGTDFAVAEECNRYSECDAYVGAYGDHVLVIEYRRADFDAGCAAFPGLSIVLRDLDLVTPSDAAYVYDGC